MNSRWIQIMLVLANVLLPSAGCVQAQKLSEKEDIRKSFTLAAGERRQLVVDNLNGEISVVGYDGDAIELDAQKDIEAESPAKIEEAKRQVVLEIKEEPAKIVLFVDAPWRTENGVHYKGWHYYGYDVSYDFVLRVPRKIGLYLKTINHGKIAVKDIDGDLEVRNVNAGIELSNVSGPASVRTVNGSIQVSFTKNPKAACSFETVNGKVEVAFRTGLDADLKLKTFNGHVYTDFDITDLPQTPVEVKHDGRARIYTRGGSCSVRVGSGGPEFSFNTLNGNIYILKKDNN